MCCCWGHHLEPLLFRRLHGHSQLFNHVLMSMRCMRHSSIWRSVNHLCFLRLWEFAVASNSATAGEPCPSFAFACCITSPFAELLAAYPDKYPQFHPTLMDLVNSPLSCKRSKVLRLARALAYIPSRFTQFLHKTVTLDKLECPAGQLQVWPLLLQALPSTAAGKAS